MELLSPAGGMIQAKSAVISGADAIYLGARSFSARSGAANFSPEELEEIVDFCHLRGVDVHLTLNTLLLNKELSAASELIRYARKIGIDAFIVQDLGAVRLIRSMAPDVPIHGSTQMSICNLQGVRIAEKMGLSRVVLARELSLSEIAEITSATDMEIEVFVHGAICVSYSGQCLLSSMLGGRSGNRGSCAQPCRKKYRYRDREGFFLSPADMCHIDHLTELRDIGVTSVKIEGRMKGAEYVSTVTRLYRKYMDSPAPVSKEDMDILQNAFCRGDSFTDGYLTGNTGSSMMRPEVSNDDILSKRDPQMLAKYAVIYHEGSEPNLIPVSGSFSGKIGECARLKLWDQNGHLAEAVSDSFVESAKSLPLSHDRMKEQLGKMGGTPFALRDITLDWENAFLPLRELNQMRRTALDALVQMITAERKRMEPIISDPSFPSDGRVAPVCFVRNAIVTDVKQAQALCGTGIDRVFVPLDAYSAFRPIWGKELGVYLPLNLPTDEIEKTVLRLKKEKPDCLLCTNLSHIDAAASARIPAIGGFQLNLFNTEALCEAKSLGISDAVLSVELNRAQVHDICRTAPFPVFVLGYGKLPLMTTKNCLIQSMTGGCHCDLEHFITDRNHTGLRLSPNGLCGTVIYNCQPIYLADKLIELKETAQGVVLLFADESPEACKRIALEFTEAVPPERPKEYTRGHFSRGV